MPERTQRPVSPAPWVPKDGDGSGPKSPDISKPDTRELLNSQLFVERTNSVLHEMDGVEDGLQDAREAALHYVLTPEKEDLVTFDDAVAQTWARLDRVADKTKDDRGYPQRVEQLRGWELDALPDASDKQRLAVKLLLRILDFVKTVGEEHYQVLGENCHL